MAKRDISEGSKVAWGVLRNSADYPLPLTIREDASPFDVADDISAKLAQLQALLTAAHGSGGESFRALNDTLQDNYLWACTSLSEECFAMFEEFRKHSDPALSRVA